MGMVAGGLGTGCGVPDLCIRTIWLVADAHVDTASTIAAVVVMNFIVRIELADQEEHKGIRKSLDSGNQYLWKAR